MVVVGAPQTPALDPPLFPGQGIETDNKNVTAICKSGWFSKTYNGWAWYVVGLGCQVWCTRQLDWLCAVRLRWLSLRNDFQSLVFCACFLDLLRSLCLAT